MPGLEILFDFKTSYDYGFIFFSPADRFKDKSPTWYKNLRLPPTDCCFEPNLKLTKLLYYCRAVSLIRDLNNVNNTGASCA